MAHKALIGKSSEWKLKKPLKQVFQEAKAAGITGFFQKFVGGSLENLHRVQYKRYKNTNPKPGEAPISTECVERPSVYNNLHYAILIAGAVGSVTKEALKPSNISEALKEMFNPRTMGTIVLQDLAFHFYMMQMESEILRYQLHTLRGTYSDHHTFSSSSSLPVSTQKYEPEKWLDTEFWQQVEKAREKIVPWDQIDAGPKP